MVNLKKISAIAASALFLGATLGTASAATFQKNMLVQNNDAKAKIVTGTANPDASGLAADASSAATINSAIASTYSAVSGGANVEFAYDEHDLDDDDATAFPGINVSTGDRPGDDMQLVETADNVWDERWMVTELSNLNNTPIPAGVPEILNLSDNWPNWTRGEMDEDYAVTIPERFGIWLDADGDGDIEDDADWPIYNDVFIVDRTINDVVITPAMRVGNLSLLEAKIIELKNQEYWIKEFDSVDGDVDLVPINEEDLISAQQTQDMLDSALLIPGTDIKVGMQNLTVTASVLSAKFSVIEGGSITEFEFLDNSTTDPLFVEGTDTELVADFFIIPTAINVPDGFVTFAIGRKVDEITIGDGDRNVLGYAVAEVDEDDDGIGDELRLEDDSLIVPRDSEVQLANSDAWFKYDKDKQIDVIRKKKATTASGSSIDSDKSPWSEFLEQDIIASAVGGTQQAVSLSIVKDTDVTSSDKTNFNLVLMGGPVANVLTSDLVTQGKSTVDWFTSSGDIEVISNAFVTGRTAIVVAGKNRAATATAASNLAAQV
jgi:hypothetical protein